MQARRGMCSEGKDLRGHAAEKLESQRAQIAPCSTGSGPATLPWLRLPACWRRGPDGGDQSGPAGQAQGGRPAWPGSRALGHRKQERLLSWNALCRSTASQPWPHSPDELLAGAVLTSAHAGAPAQGLRRLQNRERSAKHNCWQAQRSHSPEQAAGGPRFHTLPTTHSLGVQQLEGVRQEEQPKQRCMNRVAVVARVPGDECGDEAQAGIEQLALWRVRQWCPGSAPPGRLRRRHAHVGGLRSLDGSLLAGRLRLWVRS